MRISRFFSHAGLEVLAGEIIWIWVPVTLITVVVWAIRTRLVRKKRMSSGPASIPS